MLDLFNYYMGFTAHWDHEHHILHPYVIYITHIDTIATLLDKFGNIMCTGYLRLII